jgi:hypothetical protein
MLPNESKTAALGGWKSSRRANQAPETNNPRPDQLSQRLLLEIPSGLLARMIEWGTGKSIQRDV